MRRALAFCGALAAAGPAAAESLAVSLSSYRVAITSNYTGTQVVVFGAVERDAQTISRASPYDVVVTVRGPREAVVVREKQALGPIWINRAQKKFADAPAFMGVYASRALRDITTEPLRARFRVGLEALVAAPAFAIDRSASDPSFRAALLRLKTRERLFVEQEEGVAFLTPIFFRAPIPLPATAPPGTYEIEIKLFADSVPLVKQEVRFELVKAGFEQQAADFARDHGTLYGMGIAAMSLLFGWFASIIFRRD